MKAADHPAYPHVVYGQTCPAPEPTSESERIARQLKLITSARRQAIAIVNYEEAKAKIAEGEDYRIPIPVLRSCPPLLCVNSEYYRYSQKEWDDAVAAAIVTYRAQLLEQKLGE
jgi:hypothetical protein